jgi:hypothetical protein
MKLNDADAVYVGATAADAAYLGNVLVWSATVPVWTPDELFTGPAPAYWTTPSATGVKTQDVLRTTAAETLNDPIGSALNLSQKSTTGNIEQATTSLKPLVSAGNFIKRTTNTQFFELPSFTASMAAGFTLAVRVEPTVAQTDFFIRNQDGTAGTLSCEMVSSSGGTACRPRMAVGSTTLRTSSSTAADILLNTSANVIFTADAGGLAIYLDGVLIVSDVVGATQTSWADLIIGRGSRSANAFARSVYGNIAIIPASVRGNDAAISTLNEWLGTENLS